MRSSWLLSAISALCLTTGFVYFWDLAAVLETLCSQHFGHLWDLLIYSQCTLTSSYLHFYSWCVQGHCATYSAIVYQFLTSWRPELHYCSQEIRKPYTRHAFWATEKHNCTKQCMSYVKWKGILSVWPWFYEGKGKVQPYKIPLYQFNKLKSKCGRRTRLPLVNQLLINWGKTATC